MWPAKRKQPRPRSPACAGKAVRLPFPQQKPPFGAVFLWAADGIRLMPPAAKVPVCLRLFGRGRRAYEQRRPIGIAGSTRSPLSPGQAARNTDRPCRCPHRPRTGASRPTSSQPAALLRRSRKTTAARSPGCRRCHAIKGRRDSACRSWSIFLFATLRVPNHPACRFTENAVFRRGSGRAAL